MTKPKLLIISQWFDPEPTLKGIVFARQISKLGFDVSVVTGFPNYPGGKIYPGYKIRLIQVENIDGVRITRLPLFPSHGPSSFGRVLNYVSFSLSVIIYLLFFENHFDIIYAYHPPLTVGFSATIVSLFRKIPLVYDIQDMWPDSLSATGMITNKLILQSVSILASIVYSRANHIVVQSHGFKSLLMDRGVPENKIHVIFNWAKEASTASTIYSYPKNFPSPDKFKILYAGNMGKAQALNVVLEAADRLKIKLPVVQFVLMGDGVEANILKQIVYERKISNVIFLPSVSLLEVHNYLHAADVLLVHLKSDPLFGITIPSKTQAYMAVGKPILMAVDGEASQLVKAAECGICAKSDDAEDIAKVVEKFARLSRSQLNCFGRNGKEYYYHHSSLEVGVDKFTQIFRTLI